MARSSRIMEFCLVIILCLASFSSSAGHHDAAAREASTSLQTAPAAEYLKPASSLKRGYDVPVSAEFRAAGIEKGGKGVDFTLLDIKGQEVTLSGLLQSKPVAMILGSYT